MISMHAGRLLLVCDRVDRTWHAHVVLGPKPEHRVEVNTGTAQLQDAIARAKSIYIDAVIRIRPAGGQRMCWDCLQWDLRRNCCELGIPEARRSAGRFAPKCEMYDAAIGLPN